MMLSNDVETGVCVRIMLSYLDRQQYNDLKVLANKFLQHEVKKWGKGEKKKVERNLTQTKYEYNGHREMAFRKFQ